MTLFTAIKKWLHRMFGKTEEKTVQPVKTKKKLSRADKKQIEAAIARANRTDKKGKSAQDSIPYERMWPDGICRISDSHYTKTIQFQDINYQLSQNEDKTAIFEGWCDFLNYFDSSIHFQLSFLKQLKKIGMLVLQDQVWNRVRYSICGGRNGVSSPHLPPLFLFVCILVFCLSVPDNMSRIRSVAKE